MELAKVIEVEVIVCRTVVITVQDLQVLPAWLVTLFKEELCAPPGCLTCLRRALGLFLLLRPMAHVK